MARQGGFVGGLFAIFVPSSDGANGPTNDETASQRVSLDASNRESFKAIRGADYFNRITRNVRAFRALQERDGIERPLVSLWLTRRRARGPGRRTVAAADSDASRRDIR